VAWYRTAEVEFPCWETVRLEFRMNEQTGWRRELETRLNMAQPNLVRLLNHTEAPLYHHYLTMVAFLEEHGVTMTIRVPASAIGRVSQPAKPDSSKFPSESNPKTRRTKP
jgi:hypothetical protein